MVLRTARIGSIDPVARFCKRCASPLDVRTAFEFEEKRNRKDETVVEVIERIIKKLNLEKVVYETIKELKLEKEFEENEDGNKKKDEGEG